MLTDEDILSYYYIKKQETETGVFRVQVFVRWPLPTDPFPTGSGEPGFCGAIQMVLGKWRVLNDQGFESSSLTAAVRKTIENYLRQRSQFDEVFAKFLTKI